MATRRLKAALCALESRRVKNFTYQAALTAEFQLSAAAAVVFREQTTRLMRRSFPGNTDPNWNGHNISRS